MAVHPRGGRSDGEGGKPTSKKWAAAAETAEGLERNPGAYRSLKPAEGREGSQ
jgi:hypothetical protein